MPNPNIAVNQLPIDKSRYPYGWYRFGTETYHITPNDESPLRSGTVSFKVEVVDVQADGGQPYSGFACAFADASCTVRGPNGTTSLQPVAPREEYGYSQMFPPNLAFANLSGEYLNPYTVWCFQYPTPPSQTATTITYEVQFTLNVNQDGFWSATNGEWEGPLFMVLYSVGGDNYDYSYPAIACSYPFNARATPGTDQKMRDKLRCNCDCCQ